MVRGGPNWGTGAALSSGSGRRPCGPAGRGPPLTPFACGRPRAHLALGRARPVACSGPTDHLAPVRARCMVIPRSTRSTRRVPAPGGTGNAPVHAQMRRAAGRSSLRIRAIEVLDPGLVLGATMQRASTGPSASRTPLGTSETSRTRPKPAGYTADPSRLVALAQSAEQRIVVPQVTGSIPVGHPTSQHGYAAVNGSGLDQPGCPCLSHRQSAWRQRSEQPELEGQEGARD